MVVRRGASGPPGRPDRRAVHIADGPLARSEYQTALYAALPDDVGVGVNLFTYRNNTAVEDVVADYRKAKADGGSAPVYVTEVGFHGAYFDDHPANSAMAYGALKREGAETVVFYRLLPNPSRRPTGGYRNFDVLNEDLSPTPILPGPEGRAHRRHPAEGRVQEAEGEREEEERSKISFSFNDFGLKAVGFSASSTRTRRSRARRR